MEIGKPYTKKSVTNGDGKNYGKFDRVGKTAVNDGTRFPRSVIKISNDNHKSLHPTQKPVALCEYLIKTYTNDGGGRFLIIVWGLVLLALLVNT